uniref:Ankyrin repeat protein n=1 Tax=Panagrolaimus sp. ES5 TaxID=591445 RepID=A0AC34GT65_9BILA
MDVVKELLKYGAYYNKVNEQTNETAQKATSNDDIKKFLQDIDTLFRAVKENNYDVFYDSFKKFLQEQFNAGCIKDKDGKTILHYAVINKSKKITNFLIDHESQINIHDFSNKSALYYAVEGNDWEMVKLLFRGGSEYDLIMFNDTKINNECTDNLHKIGECFELLYEEEIGEFMHKLEETDFGMNLCDV